MRILIAITFLALLIFTIHSERKNATLRQELIAVSDTLNNVLTV